MHHPDKLRSTRERIVTAEVRRLELRQAQQRTGAHRRPVRRAARAPQHATPATGPAAVGPAAVGPAAAGPAAACDHRFEPTSRYDDEHKLLTFLLRCPGCGSQKVVTTLPYEPAFRPSAA
jgi:hypothetical protein